ncbi:MAG: helix-turn-helix domain-containing protein [Bacteroidota bacterium]|nr:helix-turn-helix domain-containing protein [Bacteroidota bacterium]
MAKIKTEAEYEALMQRIEELLLVTDDSTPVTDKSMIELDMLVDLVEEYELEHYPIGTPSLVEAMKLRMYEMNLTQERLAQMLGLSQSRVSDYLTGKTEPTLKVARAISKELNIDSSIVLGV